MGGMGSGQRGRKAAVEDGLTLTLAALMKSEGLVAGSLTSGSWSWSYPGSAPFASICYDGYLAENTGWLRLHYKANGQPMDYRVRLVATRPHYGGCRWWFLCPVNAQRGIETRAAKLYLPPGATLFGSRDAYKLTYQSCRESGRFRRLFARLAADMGTGPETVRTALKRERFQ